MSFSVIVRLKISDRDRWLVIGRGSGDMILIFDRFPETAQSADVVQAGSLQEEEEGLVCSAEGRVIHIRKAVDLPPNAADERYFSRRQFSESLLFTSLGMLVGNLWILLRSWFTSRPVYPIAYLAGADEVPGGAPYGIYRGRQSSAQRRCSSV